MIDAHCHLADPIFDQDIDEVVERGKKAGVVACLVNSEGVYEFQKILTLAQKYPKFCIPCFGVHPVQYDETATGKVGRCARMEDMKGMKEALHENSHKLVAIGEVGLDFTPRYLKNKIDPDAEKTEQRNVLRAQVEMAKQYNLPLIAHSRSCGRPVIELLRETGAKNVLLHAFNGNIKSARPGVEAGFHFSFPPESINQQQKKDIINLVPIEQILLETDSPVLGPIQEERNEPANLTISAEVIAEVKNMSVDDVIKFTTQNALRLFPRLEAMLK